MIPSWCHGCANFLILKAVEDLVKKEKVNGKKDEDFAIVTGIGCHGKIFYYLNLPGINTLHGRAIPTAMGIKLAKPNLNVFGFAGDGDAYAEGVEHLVHAARYNPDIRYIVHNNQTFALTLGQNTPTSPNSNIPPLNPIKLMLATGATFLARASPNLDEIKQILEEAMKHKGFAFIEVLIQCKIFNKNIQERKFYNLQKAGHDKSNLKSAFERADEFDYTSDKEKIPTGIFYQNERKTFEDIK